MQRDNTNKEAYKKGYATSFHMDERCTSQILDSHGVWVKHQDGSNVTADTINYVSRAIETLELAILEPSKLFRQKGLLTVFTKQKCPFLRDAGGLYRHSDDQISTVSFGYKEGRSQSAVHELAHAYDYACGKASDRISRNNLDRMISRCNSKQFSAALKTRSYNNLPQQQIEDIRSIKIRGKYWKKSQEQFARAVEQLVSAFASISNRTPTGVDSYDSLRTQCGFWDVDENEAIEWLYDIVMDACGLIFRDDHSPTLQCLV